MRKHFVGYYPLTSEELKDLFGKCILAFDANTLLNLYRYSTTTAKDLLDTLGRLKDRIWLPHQAAFEFHRARVKVIQERTDLFDRIVDAFGRLEKDVVALFSDKRDDNFVKLNEILTIVRPAIASATDKVTQLRSTRPDYSQDDPILTALSAIFDGRVGDAYDAKSLAKLYQEGATRYASSIPPGYADVKQKSTDNERYGDLIIWMQMMDFAKAKQKSVVFVTAEAKDDWWLTVRGKTLGPRPELLQEFHSVTNQSFYAYNPPRFIEFANQYAEAGIPANSVSEVFAVFKSDEDHRRDLEERHRERLAAEIPDAHFRLREARVKRDVLREHRDSIATAIERRRERGESIDESFQRALEENTAFLKEQDDLIFGLLSYLQNG